MLNFGSSSLNAEERMAQRGMFELWVLNLIPLMITQGVMLYGLSILCRRVGSGLSEQGTTTSECLTIMPDILLRDDKQTIPRMRIRKKFQGVVQSGSLQDSREYVIFIGVN